MELTLDFAIRIWERLLSDVLDSNQQTKEPVQPKTFIESHLQEKYKQTQLKKVNLKLKICCINGIHIRLCKHIKTLKSEEFQKDLK